MRFVAIDTETTGVDRENDQILEIALICVDTLKPRSEWPVYHKVVKHDRYEGSPYAIALNARLFSILRDNEMGKDTELEVIHTDLLGKDIAYFLLKSGYGISKKHEKITIYVAGKNPHGFDIPMMSNRHHNITKFVNFGHRGLDPAILFLDHLNDEVPPGLEKCKERAGLGNVVTHNAKEDAFDVIDLIFKGLNILETQNA